MARRHNSRVKGHIKMNYFLSHFGISRDLHCTHSKPKITDWPNKTVACTPEHNINWTRQLESVWMCKLSQSVCTCFKTHPEIIHHKHLGKSATWNGKKNQNDPSSPRELDEIKCGGFLKSSQDPSWPHLQALFWKETWDIRRVTKAYQPTYQYLKLAVAIWPCGHNSHQKPDLAPLPGDISNPRANKVTPQDN